MTLFRGTYRIESARKKNWDYSLPGWYFVTICTERKKNYFGRAKIVDLAIEMVRFRVRMV
jgi:hypothetical protein